MKEVTITGGGLSGLALAVVLRRHGVPVQVLEAGAYSRHRVCGEFISGVSGATLADLGIADLLADARSLQGLSWIGNGRTLHRDCLPVAALGISRFVLDDRLQRRVTEMGGQIQTRARVDPIAGEGRVWSAGRHRTTGSRWIGLKAHVRGVALTDDLELHLGRNGYAGLCPVEDGWVNVCGLFRRNRGLAGPLAELLPTYLHAGGNPALAERVRLAEWRAGSACAVAGIAFNSSPTPPGLLRVGDAASFIPPFTGNGMSMAFQSAETACGPLVAWAAGRLDWPSVVERIRSGLARRFRQRLLAARCLHPLLRQPASWFVMAMLSRHHLLPFKALLSLVR